MLFSYTQTKLVSPFGRDIAQRQRGLVPASLAFQICPNTNLFACVALSVICFANASSPKGRAKKPVRTVRLTNQVIFCADLPACCSFRHGLRRATFLREEGFGLTQSKLVSPSGRDVAQRQRGLGFYFQFYPSTADAVPLPFQERLNLAPLKGELSRSD